jgi:phage shock protein A
MDEQLQKQISRYRMTAQTMGDTALEAMTRGDEGLARTAARQAAQHARIVVQLETGEKQTGPEESEAFRGPAL